jgi:hypothetical protein
MLSVTVSIPLLRTAVPIIMRRTLLTASGSEARGVEGGRGDSGAEGAERTASEARGTNDSPVRREND